jgi:hypothetical protein
MENYWSLLQAVYEEEMAGKENLARQVHKAEEEMAMWRLRYIKII